ncbi:hypothetical protein EP51_43375 (plasmid) [Rhodococcus opacus]|uniref:Uncharacterized protein n=1 Tax=Rhodococcus opacus TaxID=37919 RepID=A0A076EYV0_RHOOP|nr:hypothetical protein EP51_43375 [Rhodococcus opacus]
MLARGGRGLASWASCVPDPEALEEPSPQLDEPWIVTRPRSVKIDRNVDSDRPLGKDQNPIGEKNRLIDVVRDEKHCRSMPCYEIADEFLHTNSSQCIQGRKGFIKQK